MGPEHRIMEQREDWWEVCGEKKVGAGVGVWGKGVGRIVGV